ncbi:hypothetical protein Tco_1056474 [Tanacetum coccineum]|uniref:Xylulose kinase-1 n=1 Tax=Tanacetum coccineum TaxID=301880 RepID=A0ABQ5H4K9_9ASTR
MASLQFCDTHNLVAYLKKSEGSEGFHQIVDFLNSSHIKYALTENPPIYKSFIKHFWQTTSASTLEDGEVGITATIDGQLKTVTEASLRRHLKLEDADGISSLPNTEIFEQLALMGVEGSTALVMSISHTSGCLPPSTQPPLPSPLGQLSNRVDVRLGGAVTTISSLDAGQGSGNINKTPSMPHDSPLPGGHTPGSDEGRMQQKELMD